MMTRSRSILLLTLAASAMAVACADSTTQPNIVTPRRLHQECGTRDPNEVCDAPALPVIDSITPSSAGAHDPFTTVRIYGQNIVDVLSVAYNGAQMMNVTSDGTNFSFTPPPLDDYSLFNGLYPVAIPITVTTVAGTSNVVYFTRY